MHSTSVCCHKSSIKCFVIAVTVGALRDSPEPLVIRILVRAGNSSAGVEGGQGKVRRSRKEQVISLRVGWIWTRKGKVIGLAMPVFTVS